MEEKELYKLLEIAKNKLNDKQHAFCENYLNCHNASESYRNAGYSTNSEQGLRASASKLLSRPNVQEYIRISKQINEKFSRLQREDVIRKLEMMIHSTDVPQGQVLEAMKMLNQMNGWFAPKQSEVVIATDSKIEDINKMTDAEKEEWIRKFEAQQLSN